MVSELELQIPHKFEPIVASPRRYNVTHGGRGSAKSQTVARLFISEGAFERHLYLCTREMQNSIKDSVHRLLVDIIYELKLQDRFVITKDSIRSCVGSEFIFKGLHHNINEIKSTEGVDRCWVEEAERVSQESWDILVPTIRKEGSRFYITFNPESEHSATYTKFIKTFPPDSHVIEMNFCDNPWFPKVLRDEMEYDKRVDFEKYEHVWMGKPRRYAQNLIFKGKFRVEAFDTPEDVEFKFGADWGFSNDPSCLIRMFIRDRKLYIDYEAYQVGVEIEELPRFFEQVPGSREWLILADNARPETISFMAGKGFSIRGVEKGKGSVDDGIEFLRSFEEIIIHARCPNTYRDFDNYRWRVDRITGQVLPKPEDGSDHSPDACRYALEDWMKQRKSIFSVLG